MAGKHQGARRAGATAREPDQDTDQDTDQDRDQDRDQNSGGEAANGAANNAARAPRGKRRPFDDARKEAFLAALGEHLSVDGAAAAVGVAPQTVWLHRRRYPAFARRWLEAMDQAYVEMELLLLRSIRDSGLADVTTVTPLAPGGDAAASDAGEGADASSPSSPTGGGDAARAKGGRRTTRQSPRMLMGLALRLMQLRQANMIALTLLREAEERGDAAAPVPDIEQLKERVRALLGVIQRARRDAAKAASAATAGEGADDGRGFSAAGA